MIYKILVYIIAVLHSLIFSIALIFTTSVVGSVLRFIDSKTLPGGWWRNIFDSNMSDNINHAKGILIMGGFYIIYIASISSISWLLVHLASRYGLFNHVDRKLLGDTWSVCIFIGFVLGIILVRWGIDKKLFG